MHTMVLGYAELDWRTHSWSWGHEVVDIILNVIIKFPMDTAVRIVDVDGQVNFYLEISYFTNVTEAPQKPCTWLP